MWLYGPSLRSPGPSGQLRVGAGWLQAWGAPLDPPCRPSVRRHWQDLGYLIVYITGRPDMQKQRVVSWLCQHNFPQGMIFFSDGLVHDPLRQKALFLRNLVQEVSAGPTPGSSACIAPGASRPREVGVIILCGDRRAGSLPDTR